MSIRSWALPPYDLRQAFLAGILLPLAGLSATVVLVLVNWAENSLEARLQGDIELISRAVAPGIGTQLDNGRHGDIQRSLDSLFSIRRVYGAAVYDDNGEQVVAAGIADQDLRTSVAASDVVRTGQDDGRYRSVDGQNVYAYFSPLLDHGGRINGLLQITRDRQEIDASVQSLRTTAWWFWLAAVASSLVATLILYRRLVGRQVHTLLGRMEALARGDRAVTFQASSPWEFVEIGSGFNAMVDAIREAEDELRRRQGRERDLERQLQESERIAVIGRVTQGLAHELGAPLTVIDGRIRRLERLDADGRFQRPLKEVHRQTRRMADIVRELLNYGRAETGRRVPVPVADLLCRVAEDTRGDGPPLCVSPASARVVVHGDPVRLELAVTNLVRNALRHARGRVEAGVTCAEGRIHLHVQDDGEGVAAEDRPHIFEPFFTRQPPGYGTGLGLAIVARVMADHGGEVRHEAAPGGGSRFILDFPDGASEQTP